MPTFCKLHGCTREGAKAIFAAVRAAVNNKLNQLKQTTMQTIKVTTESTANGCEFTTGYKAIATIRKDTNGTFWARFQAYASANNLRTFAGAVEFISGAIENHFAAFGLNVEFVNE